jgi:large subunit ribosomal protein L10
MPRPEKVQAVADIKERLEESRAVFLAEYAGLSVGEQQQLRRALRAAEGEFKVVKMTLARRAAEELGHDSLLDDLTGPTGLAFASGDAVAAAKALKEFADAHEALVLKSGLLGTEPLTPERVAELAELDSREVLLAKIAGAFQAPMLGMANLLAAMPRNMATMLQQLIDKMPEEAPEPEPEALVEEPAEEHAEEQVEDTATDAADEESVTDASEEDSTDPTAEGSDEPEAAPGDSDETEATTEADDTADESAEEE